MVAFDFNVVMRNVSMCCVSGDEFVLFDLACLFVCWGGIVVQDT